VWDRQPRGKRLRHRVLDREPLNRVGVPVAGR
jgi:hypothetical protein